MPETRDNFINKFDDDNCPVLCNDQKTKDSPEHVLVCPSLQQNCVTDQLPIYNDLFDGKISPIQRKRGMSTATLVPFYI